MKPKKKKLRGIIALVTIILVSNILLLSGVSLLISSIDQSKAVVSNKSIGMIQLHTRSCLEESLFRINILRTYTGSIGLNLGDYSCQADVVDDPGNPNLKNIQITGTKGEYNYVESIVADISGEKVVIVP